jgi:MoaA/NifB/PqqE/SkfB family radical SAM enzyme
MITELSEIPFLDAVGMVITYRCQIACPHCILRAGPHRKEEISLADAFNWIEQISNYRNGHIKLLSLTGGEPFYDINRLAKISSYAKSMGLAVSTISNAFWADTPEKARETLQNLNSIDFIAFSTDIYHQEFISYENILNAVRASKEFNLPCFIDICTENLSDPRYTSLLDKLHEIVDQDFINTVITFPLEADDKSNSLKYKMSEKAPMFACTSCSAPVIFPNGKVIACIGPVINLSSKHPLVLGNLNEDPLNKILNDAEINPILQAIRVWGPSKLIEMAKDAGLDKHLPERYIENSICNACYSLMSSEEIAKFLFELSENPEFKEMIAYARVYYLQETRMIEKLQAPFMKVREYHRRE